MWHLSLPCPPLTPRPPTAATPVEAVRELLGIARSLYRVERSGAGAPLRLQDLVEVGKMLRLALQLSKPGPRTQGNGLHGVTWTGM